MRFSITALIVSLTIFSVTDLISRPDRVNQIPNGQKYFCQSCHVSAGGGGARNPFGETVNENLQNGSVRWDLIFNLDSDGDGRTNGEELLDPDGTWSQGQADPGNSEDVTHPGVADESSVENITNNSGTIVFPTPASDFVTLEFNSNNIGAGNTSLVDINGNVLFTKNEYTKFGKNEIKLDLYNLDLSEGVYFLIFRNKYNVINKKIIVQ